MVSVNQEKCIGCGACAASCGEVFEMKDGKSHVKDGQEASEADCVKAAAENCPANAITP
ncbi:ferredoxin [Candidatus Pacearchaeota archaeon]|nr:ferredoxin [Candidatus Pacearchaeota archaeon]MBD3283785.1 ferredoxin [Candidatus Pacearchaeota archaeon]